jgi:hypothetical protein
VLLLAAGCRSASDIRVAYAMRAPVTASTEVNEAAAYHDRIATGLGLPPLRNVSLSDGNRELRLSTGAGMIYGAWYRVVRIVETPEGVSGEVWRYRGRLLPQGTSSLEVERERLQRPSEWKRVLMKLDSLGADQIDAPKDGPWWADAGELYVESLRGSEYRSVAFNAPTLRQGDAARRAIAVEALIDSVIKEN